jgi:hypothetical protein
MAWIHQGFEEFSGLPPLIRPAGVEQNSAQGGIACRSFQQTERSAGT